MPNLLPPSRQAASTFPVLRHCPWQGKDIAILVLTLLLAASGCAFRESLSAASAAPVPQIGSR